MKLFLDIETRSPVDLTRSGVYVYAESIHTQIVMVSWAIDEDDIQTWYPHFGEPIPDMLYAAFMDTTVILVAHNASFERIMFSLTGPRILEPEVVKALRPIARWNCTAARAAVMGLPRTLEKVCRVLRLNAQKDVEGHRLMMKLCKPKGMSETGAWLYHEDPADILREGAYCEDDVAAERAIDRSLPEMSPFERRVWELNERMNDRGVCVDTALLVQMKLLVEDAELDVNQRLRQATDGAVPKVSNHLALAKWLTAQGLDLTDDSGKVTVGKAMVSDLLSDTDLPVLLREVLTMRQEGGKSSSAKYKAIMARLNTDGRVRGALVYCGAASTKRWSSRGTQLQNLPRGGAIKTIQEAVDDVLNGATMEDIRAKHGPPLIVASEMVRPTFTGTTQDWLARGDYSQVEARVNNWFAKQTGVLDAFRRYDTVTGYTENGDPIRLGPDAYKIAASLIYRIAAEEVSSIQRQTGKVSELACGFGGSTGAFQAFAKIYRIVFTDVDAKAIVDAWREANKGIVSFWYDTDRAMQECMRGRIGDVFATPQGLSFRRGLNALAMKLPSGNSLLYWYPKLEKVQKPWGESVAVTYFAEDAQKKIWRKFDAWGGLIVENAVQSTARDLMADSLVRLEDDGLKPVLTVHDEAVCQVSREMYPTAPEAAEAVRAIMAVTPEWAKGLPIAVDASAGPRYVKA